MANDGPPVVSLRADQVSGEATFTTTFRAIASDPDGNPLTYAWSVDGATDPSAAGTTASVTFEEAGTYLVAVRVSDGVHSASASVRVDVRDEYRPTDAPDVLVIGFAGRCGVAFVQCMPPGENRDYLGDAPQPGTMEAIAGAFEQLGYTTAAVDFRAHVDDDLARGFGYRAASDLVEHARDEWIRDFLDPTRVVLVAHSHGTQFMSLLAFDHPEVRYEYGVYLDAVCELWDFDHVEGGWFAARYGAQANYPRPLDVTGRACDAISVPSLIADQHIGDVVPWNVARALEVQSNRLLGGVADLRDNHRPDGSSGAQTGIATEFFDEAHTTVHRADSEAMNWVVDMILVNGFAVVGATSDHSVILQQRSTAPSRSPAP